MLFYRDDTLDTVDEQFCPICGGEVRKSFFWPMLHDFSVMVGFIVMALAIAFLGYLAMYQLAVYFGVEITIPLKTGWSSGAQLVMLVFLIIGCIASHFLLRLHLKVSYKERGYSFMGSRYCPKCGNRFMVLTPNTLDAEDPAKADKTEELI